MDLSLGQKSYLTEFLGKFIKGQDDKLWELAEKVTYIERGKLIATCFQAQKDPMYVQALIELVEDMQAQKGIK